MDLETISNFAISNHRKSQKGAQSDPQGTPKMILKSLKIYTWTSKSLLGDPLDPWITKMVSQVPKMEPQGLQNNSFTYKKWPISAVDQLTYQHFSSWPVDLSAYAVWGAGGRGEALKFAPTL